MKGLTQEYIVNGLHAHIIKRASGMFTYLYEIRYRKKGYNIDVSSTDIDEAKRKFIQVAKSVGLIKEPILITQTEKAEKNKNLLYLFNLNGLTAYKVSKLLGYTNPSRVYKWLYNKAEPNASTMLKLTKIFNCSAEDILHCFAHKGL